MDSRRPVTLLVKLAENGSEQFIEKFATNISSTGMFVWSRDARADGTVLQVRVEIAGGERLVEGKAIIRWSRAPGDPAGPPGWNLELSGVDPESAAKIDRALATPTAPPTSPARPPVSDSVAMLTSVTAPNLDPVPDTPPAPKAGAFSKLWSTRSAPKPKAPAPIASPDPTPPNPSTPAPDPAPSAPDPAITTPDPAMYAPDPATTAPVPHPDPTPPNPPAVTAPDASGTPGGPALKPGDSRELEPLEIGPEFFEPRPPKPAPPPPLAYFPGGVVELSGEEAAQEAVDPTRPHLTLPDEEDEPPAPMRADATGKEAALKVPWAVELSGEEAAQVQSEPTGRVDLALFAGATIELSGEEQEQVQADPTRKISLDEIPAVAAPLAETPAPSTGKTASPLGDTPPPSTGKAALLADTAVPDTGKTASPLGDTPPPSTGKAALLADTALPDTGKSARLDESAIPDTGKRPAVVDAPPALSLSLAEAAVADTGKRPAIADGAAAPMAGPGELVTGKVKLPSADELAAELTTGKVRIPDPPQRTLASNPAAMEQRTLASNPAAPEQWTLASNPAVELGAPQRTFATNPALMAQRTLASSGIDPAQPVSPAAVAAQAPAPVPTSPPSRPLPVLPAPTAGHVVAKLTSTPARPQVPIGTTDTDANIFIDPTLLMPAPAEKPVSTVPGPPPGAPTQSSGPPSGVMRRATRELPTAQPPITLKPATVPARRKKVSEGLAYLDKPPPFVNDSPLVGIDLGTTNSVCAVLSAGKPVVLKTKEGLNVIPSLVAINKQGKIVVGHHAHAEMMLNPDACIYGSKRLVGRDFESPAVAAVRERFLYEVVENDDGRAAVLLGGKTVSLEEVQAIVLTECRLLAEAFLNKRVSRAVVTCPAYFTEAQRQSIRTAGALAGLRVERILIEPTAAALAYGMNQELSRRVLVYDVGGGTFDVTLLRIEKNVFEVLATGGDVFLGGLDFDNRLIQSLVKKFESQHGVDFAADPGAMARISDQAEKAKIALSERPTVEVHLPMLQLGKNGKPLGLTCTVTRRELEDFCEPLVDRTIEIVGDLLKESKLTTSQVDEVVLVGGMSRMPLVRDRLRGLFKKAPHASVNAEEAVALGAALYTGVIDKTSNVVLIDVSPMTLGYGLPGGEYKKLIARNTPLPATASFGVVTTEDMADFVEVSVFQGEDADVSTNDYVGTVRVDGLPKMPKGLVKVAIEFKLDANCVLHVEARELASRRTYRSTLATRYTTKEVQQRLGIQSQKAQEAVKRRTEELKQQQRRGLLGFLSKMVPWRR